MKYEVELCRKGDEIMGQAIVPVFVMLLADAVDLFDQAHLLLQDFRSPAYTWCGKFPSSGVYWIWYVPMHKPI